MDSWNKRYRLMLKGLEMSNKDVAKITGNTIGTIYTMTGNHRDFPRWAKLAVVVYEKLKDK